MGKQNKTKQNIKINEIKNEKVPGSFRKKSKSRLNFFY